MSTITRKTEIGALDGTPEKRMFWSIISDYDLRTGITELIDNAIDLWASNPDRANLKINLQLDKQRQLIVLDDNAGGVKREDLRLLVSPGGSKNSPDAHLIGIFGVGSKRAVVALAESISIQTRHAMDRSYQVDIDRDWLESAEWELPAYEIPEIAAGTTRIELTRLRSSIQEGDDRAMIQHLGETYSYFLQGEGCEILVNGQQVKPIGFDRWAYPPEFPPRTTIFETWPDGTGSLNVEITAGLISDRDPATDNYGVYFYCNNRLIVKELKTREVGYFVASEAGVPHPDASLCRVIVRLNGPAKLMPWNSSKTGINYTHLAFIHLRPTLIQLVSYFSSLSRRLKDDWPDKVFRYKSGTMESLPSDVATSAQKLNLPKLPRVNKPLVEQLRAKNKKQLVDQPWTLGLIEAVAAIGVITRQKFDTRNRIALILLDSNFEIALKEFIVHRNDLFNPQTYTDTKIKEIFANRSRVIQTITQKVPINTKLLNRANHFYLLRNKLIHERATVGISDDDVENYRDLIQQLLTQLFDLDFQI